MALNVYRRSVRTTIGGMAALLMALLLSGCGTIVHGVYQAAIRQRERNTPQAFAAPELLEVESSRPFVQLLTPVQSGPGLLICEPISVGGTSVQADFGAGCARWLQFVAAGQGEFGKTPLWTSVNEARRILGKKDLRLAPADADALAGHLGVTHVATGRLEASGNHLALTYQLWAVPQHKPAGAAVTLEGTPAQIAARLPQMARRFMRLTGVAKADVPDESSARADDLRITGAIPWENGESLPDARWQELLALAPRVPLAGWVYIHRGAYVDDPAWPRVVRTLLRQAPRDAAVWGDISWDGSRFLAPQEEALQRLRRRFPHNYLLATAQNRMLRDGADLKRARRLAEEAVRCAPGNPRAWISLASTIFGQSEQIRLSRYSNRMTEAEQRAVYALYPQYLDAAQQAARVDPQSSKAWEEVAIAGTFAGKTAIADEALWKSLALNPENDGAYYWGLQMYQSKWGGARRDLRKVVQMAEAHPAVYVRVSSSIAAALRADGSSAQAAQALSRAIRIAEQRVERHAEEGAAQASLATLLCTNRQYQEAVPHFEAWMRLQPQNPVPVHNLADMYLYKLKDVDKAEALFQKATQMAPDNPRSPGALGGIYKDYKRDYAKAERMYRESLRRDPNHAYALAGLANIYFFVKGDAGKADELFQRAIAAQPGDGRTYADYAWVLSHQGRMDEAREQGRKALALNERSHPVLKDLGLL